MAKATFLAGLALVVGLSAAALRARGAEPQCGVSSLHAIATLLGKNASYDRVRQQVPVTVDGETDMLSLLRAADSLGVPLTVERHSKTTFRAKKPIGILRLDVNNGHFVAVWRHGKDWVQIVDAATQGAVEPLVVSYDAVDRMIRTDYLMLSVASNRAEVHKDAALPNPDASNRVEVRWREQLRRAHGQVRQ